MTDQPDDKRCDACRFWNKEYARDGYADCRRRAPMSHAGVHYRIANTIGLLAWWYIREHSDDDMAQEECKKFDVQSEGSKFDNWPNWPRTLDEEWCGEWEGRKE